MCKCVYVFDLYPKGIRTEEIMKDAVNTVSTEKKSKFSVRQLTIVGLLAGVTIVLGMTGWGFIPIPPINATILHIPTILGAILEGPKVGAAVGLLFGIYSLIQSFLMPNILSFVFINPLVSVVPRILIGITAYMAFRFLPTPWKQVRIGIATFIGSMTNTILVMGLIWLLYGKEFAQMKQIPESDVFNLIATVVVSHGIPEAALAVVIVTPIVIALQYGTKK